jgi:hypothetical protein
MVGRFLCNDLCNDLFKVTVVFVFLTPLRHGRTTLCLPRIPSVSTSILVARCWQAHRSLIKTGSLCLVLSSSASKCRESVSRKNAVLDQQEFGRVDHGEAPFPLQEGKHRCNWLAPAKRRVADIGGVIRRSLPRATVPAVPLPWTPGRLCPRPNAYGTADSTASPSAGKKSDRDYHERQLRQSCLRLGPASQQHFERSCLLGGVRNCELSPDSAAAYRFTTTMIGE